MAAYLLIGNTSIVQVLTPNVSEDMVQATIQTNPSGAIATTLVSQKSFDNNQASESLTALAENIEAILAQGKAIGGTGTATLDNNGLQRYFVTFTVGYDPTGAPTGTVTVDVDVPVNLLTQSDPEINTTVLAQAEKIVNDAHASLVAMSKG